MTTAGVKSYVHQDKSGSVVAMSNASGAIAEGPYTYDPYGNCIVGGVACSGGVAYKYTGRRYDPETGLYYYRARYYDPVHGRFMQTDPVGYAPDMNWYTYVGNDPTDRADPSGMWFTCAWVPNCGFGPDQNPHDKVNLNVSLTETNGDTRVAANSSPFEIIKIVRDLADYATEISSSNTRWAAMGKAGKSAAEEEIISRGYTIIGRQIYVRTPLGLRIVDFLVTGGQLGKGVGSFEVKVNGAGRTPSQVAKDNYIRDFGGEVRSWNSSYFGQKIKFDTGTHVCGCWRNLAHLAAVI